MDQQKEFTIWFAGFYEGEGTICNDKSNNNRMRLNVSQNDKTPLITAKEIWGGSIIKRVRKSPASDKICTCYEWRLGHHGSLKFFSDIRPYMRIPYKINQYETVFEKSKLGSTETYSCHFCSALYANPAGRRRHEQKEHLNKGLSFLCDNCNLSYKSRDSLRRHVRNKHSNTNASPEIFISGPDAL